MRAEGPKEHQLRIRTVLLVSGVPKCYHIWQRYISIIQRLCVECCGYPNKVVCSTRDPAQLDDPSDLFESVGENNYH